MHYRYGSPRVTEELHKRGFRVNHKRIERLMKEHQLHCRRRKKFKLTTLSAHKHAPAANVLARQFSPGAPDRVWVSDITYIPTAEGWLYLAVILDLYSRRVIGWAMGRSLSTDLVVSALWTAIIRRRPPEGLIMHSDRGVQYASHRFRRVLGKRRYLQSMSRKGDCWDNACAESFFKTLKSELIGSRIFSSRAEAKREIFQYIECFYNRLRLHSYLGYRTPEEFERLPRARVA